MNFATASSFRLFCFLQLAWDCSATLKSPAVKADQCKICSTIADKFLHGISLTSKSNFGGGNTRWEEENLGKYFFSETRFIEIVENICTGEAKECHQMLEAQEELLEMWWKKFYAQRIESDLREYLCVRRLKVCCPSGTYGPDCRDCKGGRKNPCNGNGKCDGDGTKGGTGECRCEVGYEGPVCQGCSDGFHDASQDSGVEKEEEEKEKGPAKSETKPQLYRPTCVPCHQACRLKCRGRGPESCQACKEGWVMINGVGCSDLNECEDESMCASDEFCTNTEGSYKCTRCHKACGRCHGPELSDCITCNVRYYRGAESNCTACHESCLKSCTDQTPKTCDQCRKGWKADEEGTCQDIDECLASDIPLRCSQDEYCVNTIGSYKCSTCHPNCAGCHGAGNNKCQACKEGYWKDVDDSCIDVDECQKPDEACPGENKKCINFPGSYRCDCLKGFRMQGGLCLTSSAAGGTDQERRSSYSGSSSSSSTSQKKTNEPKKIKKMKKVPIYKRDLPQYLMRLAAFTIVCRLTKRKLFVQSAVAFAFAGYLYYYASELEGSMAKV